MKCKEKILTKWLVPAVAVFIVITAGCSRQQGAIFEPLAEPLVWPQPPEKPRISYVGSLMSESDLRPGASFSQALTEAIFGKKKVAVLISPAAVASDGQRIYVADSSAGVVHCFDLQTREYKQVSGLTNGEQLSMPVAIALTPNLLFVADSVLRRVCVFDKDGEFQFSLGQEVLTRPTGLAFLPSQQKLYDV